MKFAIVGLGFIVQRHIDAIRDLGHEIVAVCDIDSSKKIKVPEAVFFEDYKSIALTSAEWIVICTPNYLHAPMIKFFAGANRKILCEKPLVINMNSLETIKKLSHVYSVLQLRYNPELIRLKKTIDANIFYEGNLNLNLHRGEFYEKGWKGKKELSGGLLYNIGIHYFDLLIWFFGDPVSWEIYKMNPRFADGQIKFKNANIIWHLSIDAPMDNQIRHLNLNNQIIDLTRNFEGLHTKVYENVLMGKGILPEEAGRAIQFIEKL